MQREFIFLTRDESDTVRLAAIEAGVSGVLYKSRAGTQVVDGVRSVAEGGTLISPSEIVALLNKRRRIQSRRDSLSGRERDVLLLMARGAGSREIATRLGISYITVRSHLRNLCSKLGAHSKIEVILKARELSLID